MTVSVIILFIMGINGTDLSYTETIQSLVKSNPDWFVPASVKTVLSFAFLWEYHNLYNASCNNDNAYL